MENILKKGSGPGIGRPESWFYHILDMWPWINYLKSESPSPHLQKRKTIRHDNYSASFIEFL